MNNDFVDFKVGDLVKLKGISKVNTPIGIIIRIISTSHAKVKWSNKDVQDKWALHNKIQFTRLERIV